MLTMVMVFMLAGKADGQELEINCIDVSCYNDGTDDGSVRVEVTSVHIGVFNYRINTDPERTSGYISNKDYTFDDLPTGINYTVTVDYQNPTTLTKTYNISITQPPQFTGIDVIGWSCASSPDCNGYLRVTMNGGIPDYRVQISGAVNDDQLISSNQYLLESNSLCAGTYDITVTDHCGVPQVREDFLINLDDGDPVCTTGPEKEDINNFDISSSSPTYYNVYTNSTPYQFTFNGVPPATKQEQLITITNSKNYSDLQLQISVSQTTGSWLGADYISVDISKDGGFNWEPQSVFIDYCDWSGIDETSTPPAGPCNVSATVLTPSAWFDIGNPSLSNDIIIRINTLKETAGTYTVQGINVQGYDIRNLIISDGPVAGTCTDVIDPSPDLTHTDGNIIWYCNESGNFEFKFTRTWRITDDCGNSTEYPQLISVSSASDPYPQVQSQAAAKTIDFCKNLGVVIDQPTLAATPDNCSPLSEITFEWKIYDYENNELNSWTNIATTNTFDFPAASTDAQTFTVGWRITDEAGFSTIIGPAGVPGVMITSTQIITLNPLIILTLERHSTAVDPDGTGPYDICSGKEATFLVRAFGGNGDFNITPLLPAGSNLSWSSGDDTGALVTSGLTTTPASTTIRLQYQDTDGCPSTPGTIDFLSGIYVSETTGEVIFIVHPNITTNQLIRVP
jgi:hypothetical protein